MLHCCCSLHDTFWEEKFFFSFFQVAVSCCHCCLKAAVQNNHIMKCDHCNQGLIGGISRATVMFLTARSRSWLRQNLPRLLVLHRKQWSLWNPSQPTRAVPGERLGLTSVKWIMRNGHIKDCHYTHWPRRRLCSLEGPSTPWETHECPSSPTSPCQYILPTCVIGPDICVVNGMS